MRRRRPERDLADRVLSGDPTADTPAALREARAVLDALRAREAVDPARERRTVAAMAETIAADPRGRRIRTPSPRPLVLGPRFAAAVLAGALASGTGLAFTGALPGPAQDAARTVFSKIGVTVPAADRDEHPGRGRSGDRDDPATPGRGGHGEQISERARTTESEGREKGEEISEEASEGKRGGNASPSPSIAQADEEDDDGRGREGAPGRNKDKDDKGNDGDDDEEEGGSGP